MSAMAANRPLPRTVAFGMPSDGRPPESMSDRSVHAKCEETVLAVGRIWSEPMGRYGSLAAGEQSRVTVS